MRPLPSDDAHTHHGHSLSHHSHTHSLSHGGSGGAGGNRPRTTDPDGLATFRLPAAPQMSYVLTDEPTSMTIGHPPPHRPPPLPQKDPRAHDTAPAPEQQQQQQQQQQQTKPRVLPSYHDFERNNNKDLGASRHRPRPEDLSRPLSPILPRASDTNTPSLSQPLTPTLFGASGPASSALSASSVSSSRRNSLCLSDDVLLPSFPASVKGDVAVEDDDDDEEEAGVSGSSMMDSGSAPQLVMPSIKMPSRRPFTEEGKRMGRLKVLVAGDSGVGKTSLIKAVVQACEHIVHVDPITPAAGGLVVMGGRGRGKGGRRKGGKSQGTREIVEVYASTKPYPEWWSEMDDAGVLRRRKSMGDAVLDRNICFVDTPGYGSGSSVSWVLLEEGGVGRKKC